MAKRKDSLARTAKETRLALFRASDVMRKQIDLLSDKITDELARKGTNSQKLAQLLTAEGIMIDKMTTILKNLRGLEGESGSELEASFVIIEEDPDGKRHVVSCALELPAMETECDET